jgi:hypothetical protein
LYFVQVVAQDFCDKKVVPVFVRFRARPSLSLIAYAFNYHRMACLWVGRSRCSAIVDFSS